MVRSTSFTRSGHGALRPIAIARVAFVVTLVCALAASAPCRAGDLVFDRHVLNPDSEFLAAAVLDINSDGKLDIACGEFWYEAPSWKQHLLRKVEIFGGRPDGYAHQLLDVNADGWLDIVTVNWRSKSLKWIEHPGKALGQEQEWKTTLIAEPGPSETGRLVDVNGDGLLDILPNGASFAAWWEFQPQSRNGGPVIPSWTRHELPRELIGHGLGFGDVNGDGRADVIGRLGWAEAPADRRRHDWRWHGDFDLDVASVPILVVDVDGDRDNDLVWSRAHDYGVYWLEQVSSKGKPGEWVKHSIDTSWAGGHAPLWVDLDGDGQNELVLGKRYLAHEGHDPGEYDPMAAYRYQFDRSTRTWNRWLISYNEGAGFGLDPKAVDLDGDGDLDLVCGGRHGLYWFENRGAPSGEPGSDRRAPQQAPAYRDHSNLLVVRDATGHTSSIGSPFDWGQRRAQILAAVTSVTGPLPEPHRRVPLDMRVESQTETRHYVRKKISYAAEPGDRVPAYLLIPRQAQKRGPAVLCLHGNTPLGKDEPAGLGGREPLHFAHELAERGFVCLVPDYPSFGEYHYDFSSQAQSYASGSMKAVWNNVRGLDLLESLPEVNVNRMGCIGHGLGGLSALLTAAFDNRVTAVVSSSGFTSFARYPNGSLQDLADPHLMPLLKQSYHSDPARIPFDFAELIATLAPRSVFVIAPLSDKARDAEGVKLSISSASEIYRFLKAEPELRAVHPENDDSFPTELRNRVYQWLDQALKARPTPALRARARPPG